MINLFGLLLGAIWRVFRARRDLLLENLALRQQLAALKRRHPRPRLMIFDRVFWILAHRFWSAWKQVLVVVTPETVVRWHRAGFRSYWSAISLRHRQTWAAGPRKSVLYKIVWKRKVRSGKRRYLLGDNPLTIPYRIPYGLSHEVKAAPLASSS